LGAQTAWLSCNSTGAPIELTRLAPVVHWATTQGTGEPETLNGQAVTVCGALMVTSACPATRTRGLGMVG
jgi:hypothetical protein